MNMDAVHCRAASDIRRLWPAGLEIHQLSAARYALQVLAAIELLVVFSERFELMNYFAVVKWIEEVKTAAKRAMTISQECGVDVWAWLPSALAEARREYKPKGSRCHDATNESTTRDHP